MKQECRLGRVFLIDMTEVAPGRHFVPHQLFQLLDLGKAPMLFARPDQLAVDPDFEHAARVIGNERDRTELLREGG